MGAAEKRSRRTKLDMDRYFDELEERRRRRSAPPSQFAVWVNTANLWLMPIAVAFGFFNEAWLGVVLGLVALGGAISARSQWRKDAAARRRYWYEVAEGIAT